MFLETLSQSLGAAPDVEIWGAGNVWNWAHFLLAALVAETLFLLLVSIFVPLGEIVRRQLDSAPPAITGIFHQPDRQLGGNSGVSRGEPVDVASFDLAGISAGGVCAAPGQK
jgi:hypothetical protein